MKPREIRDLGDAELAERLRAAAREVQELRLKHNSGDSVEKPVRIRQLRRDVARLQTVRRQREMK